MLPTSSDASSGFAPIKSNPKQERIKEMQPSFNLASCNAKPNKIICPSKMKTNVILYQFTLYQFTLYETS